MKGIIIKPSRSEDVYVIWGGEFEGPIAYGTRVEIREELIHAAGQLGNTDYRLQHADAYGSSATPPYGLGYWRDDRYLYDQRGYLHRKDLVKAVDLLAAERHEELWDLLTPFDGETEVRRG